MRRHWIAAAALAVSLMFGACAAPAWAYFTDTHQADGGLPIKLQPPAELKEWYGQATKHVVVTNSADATAPVFVRAKVQTSLKFAAAGDGWKSNEDGWYYYDEMVKPGKDTKELTVKVTFPTVKSEEQPDGAVYGESYSVIVLYETTMAVYDNNGNPAPNWGNGENGGS